MIDLGVMCQVETIFAATIIEVLSPSTEAHDRGRKFMLYRKVSSLEEYLLIDPQSYYVELFRRENDIQ